jgi:hypothetical protein
MHTFRTEYISIIASNFLQPLATVIAKLVERERRGVAGKPIESETDWAATSVLLSMTLLECWTAWPRQHRSDRVPREDDMRPFYTKLRESIPDLPDLDDALLLRNAIAHNHRWRVEFEAGENERIVSVEYLAGGRRDLQTKVDNEGRSASGLHLIPSMIDRSDVKLVLEKVCAALDVMTKFDLLLPSFMNHVAVWPDGRRVTLADLPRAIS